MWANSVCEHPRRGEVLGQIVTHHCRFELDTEIANTTPVHPAFCYRVAAPNDIVKNGICPVYVMRVVNQVQPNDDKVMDYQWVDLKTVLSAPAATPWAPSSWMVLEAEDRDTHQALIDFVTCLRE